MWIADNWKDYEVLDTSSGEKLERWGDYFLVRPDPQVIWNTPKHDKKWFKPNGHYHRSNKGGGQWQFFNLPEQWTINYKDLTFNLKPFSFKHTGLFPEQATNWDWFSEKIRNAGRPVKVLNLFAYTGGATLADNVHWSENSDGYRPYITDMLDNLDGDYEYIIAEGGLNDFWGHSELGEITDGFSGDFDENTMTGGMEKMFFEIKNDFPNAKVGFVITHDPFTYDAEGNFESYYERIKEVCDKWDVSYLDLYAKNNSDTGVNVRDDDMRKLYFGTESKPDGDGTHPNELGYQAIYVEPMIPWLKSL